MSVSIGSVRLQNNLVLGPMAGVADLSFRMLCYWQGCALACTEMVSAKSIIYGNAHTKNLLDGSEALALNCGPIKATDRPRAVQLFGHEPDVIAEAIRRIDSEGPLRAGGYVQFDIVDINMGCPAPKIVKNGEGCALMSQPVLAGQIINAAVRATNKPVTVKIRKGFIDSNPNAAEIAKIAEANGAAAITVHGRSRSQQYSGKADLGIIAAVKRAVSIPVIGNGDIVSPQAAKAMLQATGCDGLMVARGALGNPWLFGEILHYLETGETLPPLAWPKRRKTALLHMQMAVRHKGERTAILEMRKHISWYIKGLPSAAQIRVAVNRAATYEEMEAAVPI